MSEELLKQVAEEIILAHAKDIEYLSICEMSEGYLEDLTDDEYDAVLRQIDELVRTAKVTVTW